MVDSRPSSADERVLVTDELKHKGSFSPRATAKSAEAHDEKDHDEEGDAQHGNVDKEEKPGEREPVSFTELFRCDVVLQQKIHS